MELSVENIESILRNEDIEGLLAAGAPEDEYHSEAKSIIEALSGLNMESVNENNIVRIFSDIWAESFNLSDEDIELRLPAIRQVIRQFFHSVA